MICNQFYNRSEKNQEKNSSYFIDYLLDNYKLHPENKIFLKTARGATKAILSYLNRYRKAPYITIKNNTIAQATGYCIRTVQRVTKELHRRAILRKSQEHTYAVNDYQLNTHGYFSGATSYALWHDSLSPENKTLWDTHGIIAKSATSARYQYRNVILNKSYSSLNINIIKSVSYNARARGLTNVNVDKNNHKKRGVAMLLAESKQFIENKKNDPSLREALLKPKVTELLFPPVLEELVTLLELDFQEKLKLTSFSDEALDHGLQAVRLFLKKVPSTEPIRDRVAWLIKRCTVYMNQKGEKPDWSFYYTLCNIFGLNPLHTSAIRPLAVSAPAPKKATYHTVKSPSVADLTHEVRECKRLLADEKILENNPYADFLKTILQTKLERETRELAELQGSGISNQDITPGTRGTSDGAIHLPDQGTTDCMATGTSEQGSLF